MKDRIFHAMQIPPDMARGVTLTEISGYQEIRIENFRGICSYFDTEIRILASGYMICVEGKKLQIAYYSELIMRITGMITSVRFDRRS
ncbi:MAG: YabP/YqfC family sporulation protein [Lachnospiraceae bacterium]|nr:YabP/YqfC family sporulation protein [Lachnospiraceae bacterium]